MIYLIAIIGFIGVWIEIAVNTGPIGVIFGFIPAFSVSVLVIVFAQLFQPNHY